MNEIQSGRFNGLLHKLLDMKEGAPAPTLAPEIIATLCLETDAPDWDFLGGVRRCQGYSFQSAGGAGNFANSVLQNPAGSGVLLTQISLMITGGSGATNTFVMYVGSGSPTYDGSAAGWWVDSRSGFARSAAIVGERAQAASLSANTVGFFSNVAYDMHLVPLNVVLSPGYWVALRQNNANQALGVTWFFRERTLEASELR